MVNVIINWKSKIASNHKWEVDKQEFKEIKAMLNSRFAWIRASAFLYLNSDAEWYYQEFTNKEKKELNNLYCSYDETEKEWFDSFNEQTK